MWSRTPGCTPIAMRSTSIDALIVPTRDLLDGATSRIFQERIAMVDSEWRNRPPVELRGGAAGGIVYSLDPVDQARILAVGFHRLVHWAVSHQIPLFLLDFPRSVNDPDYLVSTLAPWLRAHCSDEVALSAFARVADPGSVRFGQPEAPDLPATMSAEGLGIERRALADALDQRDAALRTAEEVLATTAASLADTRARLAACEDLLAQAQADRDSLQRSLSWRLTSPLRAVRRRVR